MEVERHWSRQYDCCIVCKATEYRHKGKGYCKKCYRTHNHDIMPVGICVKCGRTGKGYRENGSRDFVCHICRTSRIQRCHVCEKDGRIKLKLDHGVRVCEHCAGAVKRGRCSYCRQTRTVILRAGQEPICPACLVRPPAMCSQCEEVVKYYKHDWEGSILCKKCYRPKRRRCLICGIINVPQKRARGGHICIDCYEKPLRECSVCGGQKIGHRKTEEGKFVCKDCYYRQLIIQGIESVKGTFDSPWLEQLFLEYIEEKDRRQNPETVYKSIARDKPLFEKLGQHFSGPGELNRAVFWRNFYELHRTRTGQLYAFLQEKSYLSRTGVRTDDLIRQQRTLKLLQSMPEDFREVATAYHGRLTAIRQKKLDANWEPDDYGIGTLETIDLTIRFIGKFIRSLSKRGLKGITEVTSDIVDEYIADNRNIGGCIVDFMHWLHREKYILFKYKSDWKAQKYSVSRPMNDDKYDLLVDGFLNGLHPLKESLICLFALVYGIRIDTMLKIKTRDFRQDGKRLFLKLPYVELEIHDVVAVMVQKYLNETSSVNPFDAENPYLFYGWAYNEPLQYDSVRNVFSKHRIQARQIIPTAVRNFFDNGVRSPRVWMKSLGISRRTAAKYYESYNPTVLEEMNLNKRLYGSIK